MIRFLVAACATVATVTAEVPGVPHLPRPGVDADLWFHVGNDLFGLGHNADDFRTADWSLYAAIVDRLLVGANYSILTNRHRAGYRPEDEFDYIATQLLRLRAGLPQQAPRGRIDQLTPTIGWAFLDGGQDLPGWDPRCVAGLGARLHDDLAGAVVQNNLHRFRALDEVELRYEELEEIRPVLWLDLALGRTFTAPLPGGWNPVGEGLPLRAWLEAQTLVTGDGQLEGAYGIYSGIVHPIACLWTGLRYQLRRGGDHRSPTLDATDANEDGLHAILGLGYGSFYLETGYSINTHRGYGRAGLVITGRQINVPQVGRGHRLTLEGDVLLPDFGVGGQLRWYPASPLVHAELTLCPAVVLHHRRSQVHNGDYQSHELYARQTGLGLDLELALPEPLARIRPYLQLGGAWREELFVVDPDWSRHGLAGHQGGALTLYGDLGLRFYLRQPIERIHATARLGVTGWLPLAERSWYQGVNRVRYLRPGLNAVVGLSLDLVF